MPTVRSPPSRRAAGPMARIASAAKETHRWVRHFPRLERGEGRTAPTRQLCFATSSRPSVHLRSGCPGTGPQSTRLHGPKARWRGGSRPSAATPPLRRDSVSSLACAVAAGATGDVSSFLPRGAAAFLAAARFAGFLAAPFLAAARLTAFTGFLAAARFVPLAARFAGFLATFAALPAAGFFAVFVTFLAGFFAVFLAAICDPPDWPPRTPGAMLPSPEATDVARLILPRMVGGQGNCCVA